MNLRPHHLLCIQKFTGHGYDAAFTARMSAVVSLLTEDPMTEVTVTQGCDDLCKACPYNRQGACTSLEKVDFMDGAVLDTCGLSYGEKAPFAALAEKARERILEGERFREICGACEWFELCRNTEGYPMGQRK